MKRIDPHLRHLVRKPRNYAAEEPMHPLQIAAYRRMSPAEKLERIAAFQLSLLGLLKAGIRSRHPEWTEEEVASEVRERMLYAVS